MKIKKIFVVLIAFIISYKNVSAEIKDGLFFTVGNKAVTKADIVDEIKIILILNNMSYSEDKKDELQEMAIKSSIKRNIKEIEISKYDFLEYYKSDLVKELNLLAARINLDVETLKNICMSNGLDFSVIEDQLITELLWNSLIFNLYKNRLSINIEEIDEKLKSNQNKKEIEEYLISEIILKPVAKEEIETKVKEAKDMIETEGFERTAMSLSISQTAVQGGDLGWLNEREISEKFKPIIFNTPVGGLSEPILLNEGIIIFNIRDKRKIENKMSLENLKEQLVNAEKSKILNMYSLSHYDNLRRSITVNFFNE